MSGRLEQPATREPEAGADGAAPPVAGCGACGAVLALDQRYCLACGERAAAAAPSATAPALELGTAPAAGPVPIERALTSGQAAVGAALVVLALGVGVVLGRAADDDQPAPATAPVVRVVGGAGGGGASVAGVEAGAFASDWPAGREGFTVQLETLRKDGTDPAAVAAAKADAKRRGAADVGALDSNDHGSLKPGNYVVYSGVFDARRPAVAALARLRDDFPGARVIEVAADASAKEAGSARAAAPAPRRRAAAKVSRSQLEQLDRLSQEDYAKRSRKLPDEAAVPGAPPPKDSKPPGAGSDAAVIE